MNNKGQLLTCYKYHLAGITCRYVSATNKFYYHLETDMLRNAKRHL
jgi:hypothetical protein